MGKREEATYAFVLTKEGALRLLIQLMAAFSIRLQDLVDEYQRVAAANTNAS